MLEGMLDKYRIRFEGMAEPVFYKYFYPVYNNDHYDALWHMFWFVRGLKRDASHADEKFAKHHNDYLEDVRELLNTVWTDTGGSSKRRGVAAVPSSDMGLTNRVTELVRETLAANPAAYVDLTSVVVRSRSKEKSHGGGTRSISANKETLEVRDPELVGGLDVIVVVDDVVTTGNSFRAIGQMLRDAGFRGQLINFAFAFTRPSDSVAYYLTYDPTLCFDGIPGIESLRMSRIEKSEPRRPAWLVLFDDGTRQVFDGPVAVKKRAAYRKVRMESGACRAVFDPSIVLVFSTGDEVMFSDESDVRRSLKNAICVPPVEGIVFDLDQTLLDDAIREERMEPRRTTPWGQPETYQTYDGVRELMGMGIPFAIVSNRPENQLAGLMNASNIKRDIFREKGGSEDVACNQGLCDPASREAGASYDIFEKARSLPENVFSYTIVEFEDEERRHYNLYKPCPNSVECALGYLRSRIKACDDARIVGIGNTHEDIIAYNASGIESVLALWGVPSFLREHAIRKWGADYAFESVREFMEWCECGGPVESRLSR